MSNEIVVSDEALRFAMMPYETVFEHHEEPAFGKYWVARNPELGMGIIADGPTREEAYGELACIRCEVIQLMIDDGDPIPLPKTTASYQNQQGETIYMKSEAFVPKK